MEGSRWSWGKANCCDQESRLQLCGCGERLPMGTPVSWPPGGVPACPLGASTPQAHLGAGTHAHLPLPSHPQTREPSWLWSRFSL